VGAEAAAGFLAEGGGAVFGAAGGVFGLGEVLEDDFGFAGEVELR
jgi:hypothetical protein